MREKAIVHVVDDDKPTRDIMCEMINARGLRIKSYISAEDFLEKYTENQLESLVLDIRMPGISGMELLAKLSDNNISLPVVVVTGHGDIPMAVDALNMGAVDFLEKPFREQSLYESINKALETCKTIRSSRQSQNELKEALSHLTERDIDALKLLLEGYSDKQVANKLGISRRAVAFHRSHILEKTGFDNIVSLATLMTKVNISL